MTPNLDICFDCKHFLKQSENLGTYFAEIYACNLDKQGLIIASVNSPKRKNNIKWWDAENPFQTPDNCPYILEHTIL